MADEAASDIWVNSWFTIWYEPRSTIRRIVDADAHRFVVGIAFVSGAMAAIYSQVAVSTVNISELPHLPHFGTIGLTVGAIISGVLSVISLYGLAALYRWSGHILGGTATRVEMRSALAWAEVPGLYLGLANIVAALIGFEGPGAPSVLSASGIVDSIAGIWIFVILLKCIGEVHHFSAWRALGAIILGFLAMIAVVVAIVGAIWLAVAIGRSIL
ncbi:MAG TPA: YIP1 family protein [Candidatus Binataceae bacterium]